jgi:outer membrane protein OmpA-like peptidoglycan-associated protein
VPGRAFSKIMHPDPILLVTPVPHSDFFAFEYSFIADGKETYLTFGTYIKEDTTGAKKKLIGVQTVSIVLDNFQLIPENNNEIPCPDLLFNKEKIYNYNFRHKEMDYSLFGKGELAIRINNNDPGHFTLLKEPETQIFRSDTLQLGDVFFDFNKANLKPEAVKMLEIFFQDSPHSTSVDSLYIDGHTDAIGTDKSNIELSNQRCETIRDWLLQNTTIPAKHIFIRPYGKSRPIASNRTPEGRALNRRVELIIFRKAEN